MTIVTLNAIPESKFCGGSWHNLLSHLGKTKADDEPLPLRTIFEISGLFDALWCLQALPPEWEGRVKQLTYDFAESALKYVPTGEDRPAKAIATARAFARGEVSLDELSAAHKAACDAFFDLSDDVEEAAWDAASAAALPAAIAAANAAAWQDASNAFWAAWTVCTEKTQDVIEAIFVAWLDEHETA